MPSYKSHIIHGMVEMSGDVYWKLLRMNDGLITVACLQWFDEFDIDENKFICNSEDRIHVLSSSEQESAGPDPPRGANRHR